MRIEHRIRDLEGGFRDLVAGVLQIVKDLERENTALKMENRILQARLQEARRVHPEPAPVTSGDPLLIPPSPDPTRRCWLQCACGRSFWAKSLLAQHCPLCLSSLAIVRQAKRVTTTEGSSS